VAALPSAARAEALSTTQLGFGIRDISYTQAPSKKTGATGDGSGGTTDASTAASDDQAAQHETFQDPLICHRVSTPSSLGLELGAGGCIHGGGFQVFAHTISAFAQLIYYPLASRQRIDDDAAIRVRRQFFGDLYFLGQGGFAKITHKEDPDIRPTLSTDVAEFGGGIGWSYRMFDKMAFGVEGTYLIGTFLSPATTGSTSMITATGSITVFL
jgi:hypothetical protein